MTTPCHRCQANVTDNVNGTVYGPAPWEPEGTTSAICYRCENAQELAADQAHLESTIAAALRAGRADCV